MTLRKLSGFCLILSLYGCKTTEAAGAKASDELKKTIQTVSGGGSKLTDSSPMLLQWVFGRLSLVMKNEESVEVKDKPGRVICSLTEASVTTAFNAAKVEELRSAIKVLSESKGNTRRNPMFRAYDESRELLAYQDGSEFVLEASYQAQEVITPKEEKARDKFDQAYDLVLTVARDSKVCPNLGG